MILLGFIQPWELNISIFLSFVILTRAEQTVCIRYCVTVISSDSKYRIVTFEYESLLVSGINALASDVCNTD